MCVACSRDFKSKVARGLLWLAVLALAGRLSSASGQEVPGPEPTHPGWKILRTRPFLPADFDQATFDSLYLNWPEPERSTAAQMSLADRRRATATYYGLTLNPWAEPEEFDLLGYVKTDQGWVMNCLACHGGMVDGKPYPGVGNNRYALQTLTEDVRRTKLFQLKTPSHLDLAILKLPLNTTNGTSNSVIFGVILGAMRLPDMSVDKSRPVPPLVHHDLDAPPWWHLQKKSRLYADGFSPKSHRAIMQFMLLPENDRDTVLGWEDDFRQILDWMQTIQPPRYAGPVDNALASQGRTMFQDHCARCHGSSGTEGAYPERVIPIDELGTDPVRLTALAPEHRQWMHDGWMSRFGQDRVDINPAGYVAPPLDGIWASAPYFHNGSVPTLWHVLHPEDRPKIWTRTEDAFDAGKVGLSVREVDRVPDGLSDSRKRWYFDTTRPSKSAAGHLFVNELREDEKRAVLEYLKTL